MCSGLPPYITSASAQSTFSGIVWCYGMGYSITINGGNFCCSNFTIDLIGPGTSDPSSWPVADILSCSPTSITFSCPTSELGQYVIYYSDPYGWATYNYIYIQVPAP